MSDLNSLCFFLSMVHGVMAMWLRNVYLIASVYIKWFSFDFSDLVKVVIFIFPLFPDVRLFCRREKNFPLL